VLAVPDEPPELVVTPPEVIEPPLAADVPPVLELVLAALPPLLVGFPPVFPVALPPLLVGFPPVFPVALPPLLVVVPPMLPVVALPGLVVVPPLAPPVDPGPEPPTGADLPADEELPPGPEPGAVGLQAQLHRTTPHKTSLGQVVLRMFCLAYPRMSVFVDQLVENRWHDTQRLESYGDRIECRQESHP